MSMAERSLHGVKILKIHVLVSVASMVVMSMSTVVRCMPMAEAGQQVSAGQEVPTDIVPLVMAVR